MGTAIRTRIVKIGNSQGIRIPKPLLEVSGICTEVEIEVQDDYLIVRAAPKSVLAGMKRLHQWQSDTMISCLTM
jgi:antitoxin component of MazEF toxin-antitoxin module